MVKIAIQIWRYQESDTSKVSDSSSIPPVETKYPTSEFDF